jgi:dTDP-4-dehydrorhamnose 3,5-epimerase
MEITESPIPDLLIIQPKVFEDERGYFFESYNKKRLSEFMEHQPFVQDNEAMSSKGVLRGLHFQTGEFSQAKLVRVIKGSVWDVAVDIRPGSATFGQWFGMELSEANKTQMFVPRGFAHGYLTLTDHTIFSYKCDNYYSKEHEGGIKYDDPQLNIDWPVLDKPYILSEKDKKLNYMTNA